MAGVAVDGVAVEYPTTVELLEGVTNELPLLELDNEVEPYEIGVSVVAGVGKL